MNRIDRNLIFARDRRIGDELYRLFGMRSHASRATAPR
ncbi:MAG: hypothetical protein JWR30_523 [Conexibacter sp.]|jgi:hypothetical protein|nr:hypothetical protein [Conexibacter sp.]MCZ4495323.1 hypothetical protein [Conexibacter sp.]MDT5080380.1 hypothetical protein [Mycobacterium sp.]